MDAVELLARSAGITPGQLIIHALSLEDEEQRARLDAPRAAGRPEGFPDADTSAYGDAVPREPRPVDVLLTRSGFLIRDDVGNHTEASFLPLFPRNRGTAVLDNLRDYFRREGGETADVRTAEGRREIRVWTRFPPRSVAAQIVIAMRDLMDQENPPTEASALVVRMEDFRLDKTTPPDPGPTRNPQDG